MRSAFPAAVLYFLRTKQTAAARPEEESSMSLFTKKETVILKTEQQKDAYIEKLNAAHVDYEVYEDRETIYSRDVTYIVKFRTADLKKVG